jgi:CheY-like chemotaxis protein
MTKKVLIIDDEEIIREIVQFALELVAGWQVISADSGEVGLALATTEQPDAILLDVMMPDIDGIMTFQEIQANPAISHIPTILLTAKTKPHEHQHLTQLGVQGIIAKPFTAQQLVLQLRQILQWT